MGETDNRLVFKGYSCLEPISIDALLIIVLSSFAETVHNVAKETGWHDTPQEDSVFYANMHSEVSEAWAALAHNNPPSEKIPAFTSEEEELADVMIRILDRAKAKNLRLAEAMLAKNKFNKTRPHRHGGKKY